MRNKKIETDLAVIEFESASGGFPSSIRLKSAAEAAPVLGNGLPWITSALSGRGPIRPFCPEDFEPLMRIEGDIQTLEFPDLPWCDADGRTVEGFRITLNYEFHRTGQVFVWTTFLAELIDPPALDYFRLTPPINIPADNDITWSLWRFPVMGNADEALIQMLSAVERSLTPDDERNLEGMIAPSVLFTYGKGFKRGSSLEFLVEGWNSLAADHKRTSTAITWTDGHPRAEWDFLSGGGDNGGNLWQWRNRWGWVLTQAPTEIRRPPVRMYHYFDNYKYYPTDSQIAKMAAEGADAILMHENWRSDVQNGGTPRNRAEFERVVKTAHHFGIRVAPYIRGNEISIFEEGGRWFRNYLQPDYDGLYMDYGGPIHYQSTDETFPGGRIGFRTHFMHMLRLRKLVGERGLLYSHTGPFYSTAGLAGIVDGYVAGEGEQGVLISNRTAHSFLSGTAVAPGSLWTAAFPEYHTPRILPFLASVGQTSHVTLGAQQKSSSLAHPDEPDVITFMRPLWKLWGMLSDSKPVRMLHEQNTDGVLHCDSEDTGACLFVDGQGSTLLILSNFADQPRKVEVRMDLQRAGITEPECGMYILDPNWPQPEASEYDAAFSEVRLNLPARGVAGIFAPGAHEDANTRLCEFRRPYPIPDVAGQEWYKSVEEMRRLRFNPNPSNKIFVRFRIDVNPIAYEDSVISDIFHIENRLYEVSSDGQRSFLGYIGARGITSEPPSKAEYIRPGVTMPWIALHDMLPAGEHRLEVWSYHYDQPFYSFLVGELCADPADEESVYCIEFLNELDHERARLSFNIYLNGG